MKNDKLQEWWDKGGYIQGVGYSEGLPGLPSEPFSKKEAPDFKIPNPTKDYGYLPWGKIDGKSWQEFCGKEYFIEKKVKQCAEEIDKILKKYDCYIESGDPYWKCFVFSNEDKDQKIHEEI